VAWKVFGTSAKRIEDPALLTGRARFIDDISFPGMLHAAFVRSPHAHAAIRAVDATAAKALSGVHAVYAFADFAPHLVQPHLIVGLPSKAYRQDVNRPALAIDEAAHVGEPVAIVIAESRYVAEDAAALVAVDYEPLPAIADCRDALADGAPTAHRNAPHNLLAEFEMGYGDTAAVFATAPHVIRQSFRAHRGGSHSIECRGSVATWDDAEGRLTLWCSTQMPHSAMRTIGEMLGLDETRIRVVIPEIGGGFGPKLVVYQEDVSVCLASILLGRPVKWIEDRREHFTGTTQERDQYWEMEIAFDDAARILGVRGTVIHDHGAYTARGINLPYNGVMILPLPYEVPAYHINVRLALTNKVPVTPVRGAGHPQAIFAMERLLDRAAQKLGIDAAEVRRRNLVTPDKMPYTRPLKSRGDTPLVLDSGDYPACLAEALTRVGYDTFRARQAAARAEGRYIGIGMANFVKKTGQGPFESVAVRIGPSGKVLVYSGATAIGQGTRTMLAQIVAEQLGGDMSNIEVVVGDTAAISSGIGASASRQAVTAGNSAHIAADTVRRKALQVAAHMLETAEQDLEIEGREIRVKGVPDMKVSLGRIAHAVAGTPGFALPAGIEPGMADEECWVTEDLTFSNGCQVVELEVDAETGGVRFLRYIVVHDSGTIINPMMVEGQVLGGAAHGIGNALFEWMGYDEAAQPLTATFADYLLVTAPDMPHIELAHMESPSPLNPLGVKGVGECGVVPAPAAIIAAVEDALQPFGVRIGEFPVSPSRIRQLIAGGP